VPGDGQRKRRGCRSILGVGCLASFLVTLAVVAYVATHAESIASALARRGVEGALSRVSLPESSRDRVRAEVDSLITDVRQGRLVARDLLEILARAREDAALRFGARLEEFRTDVLPALSMTAEERADAVRVCTRFTKGLADRTLSGPEIERMRARFEEIVHDGKSASTEEAKQFLARARAIVDSARVPMEAPPVDLAALFRSAVRTARARVERSMERDETPRP